MAHKYLKNVTTLKLNVEKCTGCGRCAEVCPHAVFIVEDRKVKLNDLKSNVGSDLALDRCMECGACVKNCAFGALDVKTGVGCAYAVIMGMILGTEPTCDCSSDSGNSGGCC